MSTTQQSGSVVASGTREFIDYGGLVDVPETDGMVDGVGRAIEDFACEWFGLGHEPETHHDAVTESGVPVQVKGAAWRVKNGGSEYGQAYAHGRFRLYSSDHEWLLDQSGWYAFVVYEQHDLGLIPLYARMLDASALDSFVLDVPGEWWDSEGTVPKQSGSDVRVGWPRVFPEGVRI